LHAQRAITHCGHQRSGGQRIDLAQEAAYIALVSGAPGAERLTELAAALNISPELNRN